MLGESAAQFTALACLRMWQVSRAPAPRLKRLLAALAACRTPYCSRRLPARCCPRAKYMCRACRPLLRPLSSARWVAGAWSPRVRQRARHLRAAGCRRAGPAAWPPSHQSAAHLGASHAQTHAEVKGNIPVSPPAPARARTPATTLCSPQGVCNYCQDNGIQLALLSRQPEGGLGAALRRALGRGGLDQELSRRLECPLIVLKDG